MKPDTHILIVATGSLDEYSELLRQMREAREHGEDTREIELRLDAFVEKLMDRMMGGLQ